MELNLSTFYFSSTLGSRKSAHVILASVFYKTNFIISYYKFCSYLSASPHQTVNSLRKVP